MRLKVFLIFVIILLVDASILAESQNGITGLDLMHLCENAFDSKYKEPSNTTRQQEVSAIACFSFIGGFWQSYLNQLAFVYGVTDPRKIKDKNVRARLFCLPDDTTFVEPIARITLKFSRENPEILNMSPGLLVYTALWKAFPCN